MKKQKLVFLCSSLLVLTSCGETTVMLPSGGNSIEQAQGVDHLSTAMTAVGDKDAMGMKLENFTLSEKTTLHLPTYSNVSVTADSIPSPSIQTSESSSEFSGVNFSAAATGLTSKNVSDVKAAVTLSGSYKSSSKVGEKTTTMDYSGMSLGAYINDGNAYADLSNQKALEFISGYTTLISAYTRSSSTFKVPAAGKYVQSGAITADNLPLLSTDVKDDIKTTMSKISATLTTYKDYFKAYSYSDNRYAIDATLTKDTILSTFDTQISSIAASSAISSSGVTPSMVRDMINKALTINACEAVFVFKDDGPVSLKANIDVAVNTTLGDLMTLSSPEMAASLTSEQKGLSESLSFKFAFSLNFLSGSDVSVTLPSDLSTYTAFPSSYTQTIA